MHWFSLLKAIGHFSGAIADNKKITMEKSAESSSNGILSSFTISHTFALILSGLYHLCVFKASTAFEEKSKQSTEKLSKYSKRG